MRIIAGEFRSRVLRAPAGMHTRPTSDRLRETLFNVLQPRIEGARFLDLYAGSGANGLEALSRGAAQTVLVEQAAPALAALRANVEALGARGAEVAGVPVARWLARAGSAVPVPFDIIFLDPPYAEAGEYAATLGTLGAHAASLLAPGGIVIAEHARVRRKQRGTPGRETPAALAEQYGTLLRTRTFYARP